MKAVRVGSGHTGAIHGPGDIKACRLTFANEGLGISDTCVVVMFMCHLLAGPNSRRELSGCLYNGEDGEIGTTGISHPKDRYA